jgi:hypothetical protein
MRLSLWPLYRPQGGGLEARISCDAATFRRSPETRWGPVRREGSAYVWSAARRPLTCWHPNRGGIPQCFVTQSPTAL